MAESSFSAVGRGHGNWIGQVQGAPHPPPKLPTCLLPGPQFWVFQDRQLEGAARPLVEFGLPPGEEVDAVFSWPLNGKTYLIRGQQYWRYDEVAARLDPGYPRVLSHWEGAPPAPDDVTVSNTGVGNPGNPHLRIVVPGGPRERKGKDEGEGITTRGRARELVWKKRSGGFGSGLGQGSEVSPLPQVTPTFSRALFSGALRRAVSNLSRIPPSPWGPSGWTALPPAPTLKSPTARK